MALVMALSLLPAGALAAGLPFTDVKTSDWFYNDVKNAYDDGLINGKTATTFEPNSNLTYAEAVKLAACMNQRNATGMVTLVNATPGMPPMWATPRTTASSPRTMTGTPRQPVPVTWRSSPTPCPQPT